MRLWTPGTGGPRVARNDYRKGGLPYPFVVIPKDVLLSPEFQALSTSSKALLLDLIAQYTGKNNGRLCPAWQAMQRAGWTAKPTLLKAKRELLECSFVVLTRKGHAPRTAEWIGVTWWTLDFDRSMDIDPRQFPYLNFVKRVAADPNTGRPEIKREVQKLNRWPAKSALRGSVSEPMGVKAPPASVQKLNLCTREASFFPLVQKLNMF